jgi:hypothetical protein
MSHFNYEFFVIHMHTLVAAAAALTGSIVFVVNKSDDTIRLDERNRPVPRCREKKKGKVEGNGKRFNMKYTIS